MSFPLEILKTGIGIANSLTAGVQGPVVWTRWLSQNGEGEVSWDTPVTLQAVIDQTRKQIQSGGRLVTVVATLTFIGDVSPAIDPKDSLVLPDGTTGPIISTPGAVMDPSTLRGLISEVMIGEL